MSERGLVGHCRRAPSTDNRKYCRVRMRVIAQQEYERTSQMGNDKGAEVEFIFHFFPDVPRSDLFENSFCSVLVIFPLSR